MCYKTYVSLMKPVLFSILTILIFVSVAATRNPQQDIKLTRVVRPMEVTKSSLNFNDVTLRGWLPWWRKDDVNEIFSQIPDDFEVSPFYATLTKEGTISEDKKITAPTKYFSIPTIANEFDQERINLVFKDETSIDNHVADIIEYVTKNNYPGIEIDYENIPRVHRESFTTFIQKLSIKLKMQRKLLYVALHAKTSEFRAYAGAESQDYEDICSVAHKCTIMAYDKHYKGSGPGPVTPLPWLKEVIAFAQTEIPPEKLVIGLPFYGYEWPTGKRGTSRTHANILEYAQSNQFNMLFDTENQTPYIDTGTSQLWFDNEESLYAKMSYARSKGVRHFAFWALGGEGDLLRNIIEKISQEEHKLVSE
jgi:spore germination protein